MERRKTLTMNWEALRDDDMDEDHFFETCNRLSSVTPLDAMDSSSEEDEFEDPRVSFASAISSISTKEYRTFETIANCSADYDYDVWLASPGSITERRKRLLQGMGISSGKEQTKSENGSDGMDKMGTNSTSGEGEREGDSQNQISTTSPQSPIPSILVRSRSEGDIDCLSVVKERKKQFFGTASKQRLTKTSSMILLPRARVIYPYQELSRAPSPTDERQNDQTGKATLRRSPLPSARLNSRFGTFVLIKNLDTGKEFIVNEYDQDGAWNRVSDLQTGKQLTLEEFERCVGHSPVVKELMRRENVGSMTYIDHESKVNPNSYFFKSLRMSKRTGAALLKNIIGVAHSMSAKGGEHFGSYITNGKETGSEMKNKWVKARQTGKSYKELSALHLSQEIQAHQGSIWTIKFSHDGRYLASGGEDKVIHLWEAQECDVLPFQEGNLSSQSSLSSLGIGEVNSMSWEKKKRRKGSASKKEKSLPEYVHPPETVVLLSEKPFRSFTGHLDDILDLSWSKSQLLLSSSMDKTVRLWDVENCSCLKLFAHNDYVTCIQFNPVDGNFFISGSLDAKVRMWNISDRQLVDWVDLHEMVTAVCFTPDGKGALIGSHKGYCRLYQVEDCKMSQMEQIQLRIRKKSHGKKITGFQFSPVNPSEVLVTSADSRIRILSGTEVVHKFKGLRSLNSQIAGAFSLDGKYVVSASEDSNVYVWKRDEPKISSGKSKHLTYTRSYESFQCKDVSVAIPWPGTVKGEPPLTLGHSKRHSKRGSAQSTQPSPSPPASVCSSSSREEIPTGPQEQSHQSPNGSPSREETNLSTQNKKHLPPRPKKKNESDSDKAPTILEEKMNHGSCADSLLGESFSSNSSIRYGNSPSISAATGATPSSSWSSSWLWFDGNNHSSTIQTTAWGLVIVTATLSGEIRIYQNFGLPRRIGRLSSNH